MHFSTYASTQAFYQSGPYLGGDKIGLTIGIVKLDWSCNKKDIHLSQDFFHPAFESICTLKLLACQLLLLK